MTAIAERFVTKGLPVADRNNDASITEAPESLDWDIMVNELIELYRLANDRVRPCSALKTYDSFTALDNECFPNLFGIAIPDGSSRRPAPTVGTSNVGRIVTVRDVSEYWHNDWKGQGFNAMWLYLRGRYPNRFVKESKPAGWIDFLGSDCEMNAYVSIATHSAMLETFALKWIHDRMRPGQVTALIEANGAGYVFSAPVAAMFKANEHVKEYVKRNRTYALSSVYAEGHPQHPSYPAGHATVVGVQQYILRWVFASSDLNVNEFVEKEVSALVNSVCFGRMIAGIHTRTDMKEGLRVGERHARQLLINEGFTDLPSLWFA